MPAFVSKPAVWGAVVSAYAAATVFWWVQNTLQPVGGAIAFQKALWLATAVVLWLIIPAFIAADVRVHAVVRRAFGVLLALMAARGLIELPMLYVFHNWSPWYGIAHDIVCMAALLWYFAQVSTQPMARAHMAMTTAAFVPEIYFAWYMQAYFHTQGGDAIYFVPDDPMHALALNITTGAVVCFGTWIGFFLARWPYFNSHATAERPRPRA
jgi:hypothetical protein